MYKNKKWQSTNSNMKGFNMTALPSGESKLRITITY